MRLKDYMMKGARLAFLLIGLAALAAGLGMILVKRVIVRAYFVAALTAFLSLIALHLPDYLTHKDYLMVPVFLEIIFTLFVLASVLLGSLLNFYQRFPWWDTLLHFVSGGLLGIVGLLLFMSLTRDQNTRSLVNPAAIALFAFCFSITCGVLWEVYEFVGDSLFGMNMQRWQTDLPAGDLLALRKLSNRSNPGLIDTMIDLIAGGFGGGLSIALSFPFIKRRSNFERTGLTTGDLSHQMREASPAGRPDPGCDRLQ